MTRQTTSLECLPSVMWSGASLARRNPFHLNISLEIARLAWISNHFLDAGNVRTMRHTVLSLAQQYSELLNF